MALKLFGLSATAAAVQVGQAEVRQGAVAAAR